MDRHPHRILYVLFLAALCSTARPRAVSLAGLVSRTSLRLKTPSNSTRPTRHCDGPMITAGYFLTRLAQNALNRAMPVSISDMLQA